MRFGSVCSGIEASSVAWAPLGWKAAWLAEIEKFPAAVLAHHYPEVPNLGDMTALPARIASGEVEAPDIFCGGTPCQAFSVAGLRKSLDDARGNLSLVFCEIANAIDTARAVRGHAPAIIFWENVPGVLSTKDNAFGCFLAGLAGENDPLEPPGGKWTNAGCVSGPQRTVAWRVLDAQYFGVAQRRRRVFVVASARKGFDPAQILFEWDGVRRDTAPSREARQTAPTIPARSTAGGGLGTDFDCDGGLIAGKQWPADVCSTLDTTFGDKQGLEDQHVNAGCPMFVPVASDTTHTLRGEGFDASEDGTGRGTPQVPMFLHANKGRPAGRQSAHTEMVSVKPIVETLTTDGHAQSAVAVPVAFDTTQITSAANRSNPQPGDACHPLADGAHAPAIAFPANLSGTQCVSTEELAPSMGASNPTAVAAPVHAIQAGALRTNPLSGPDGVGVQADHAYTLEARAEVQAVQSAMQVRRLTPTEAERLQGFPDGYTAIPWRGKPADQCPDGPRYRALGNSWAIPCVSWIGERIQRHLAGEL